MESEKLPRKKRMIAAHDVQDKDVLKLSGLGDRLVQKIERVGNGQQMRITVNEPPMVAGNKTTKKSRSIVVGLNKKLEMV